jgi:hypothetical protein
MHEWVLILTITATHPYGASAIHSISGFTDENACTEAGRRWENRVGSGLEVKRGEIMTGVASFICVSELGHRL